MPGPEISAIASNGGWSAWESEGMVFRIGRDGLGVPEMRSIRMHLQLHYNCVSMEVYYIHMVNGAWRVV